MTKQFNVGDTVKYTSPCKDGRLDFGMVIEANPKYFEIANGAYRTGYLILWNDGNQYWIADGNLSLVVPEVTISDTKELNNMSSYYQNWCDDWDGIELVKSVVSQEPTIESAKELKAELESKILRLIQEFNKKTNLEIKDIDLDYYRAVGGECFYQVAVKVEI